MNFLLDTHILLWWCHQSEKVPPSFARQLEEEQKSGHQVGISIITLWEISKLVVKGRIETAISLDQWFPVVEDHSTIQVIPLNGRIILEAERLGAVFPKDPADQLIAATARCHGLRLMTADERIQRSGVVALA